MKKIIITAFMVASCAPSFAIWPVIDAANLMQSTLIAAKQVAAEIYHVQQMKRELLQLQVTDTSGFSDTQDEIRRLSELQMSATQLQSVLETQGDINRTFTSLYGASSASTPAEFSNLLQRRAAAGDASTQALMEASRQSAAAIQQSSAQHQKIANALPNVPGITQATQLTAASVGVVIQQQQTMIGNQAILLQSQAAKDAEVNKKQQMADQGRVEYFNTTNELLRKAQQSGTGYQRAP